MAAKLANKRNKSSAEQTIPTLIGKDCVIHGNINHAYAIRVEGTLMGDVVEAGSLIIGESGVINGNVKAKTVIIFGHINGDVSATDSIEIKNSGKVSGKLSTQILAVERGAVYDGKIVMGHVSMDSE
ncbi:protein CcmA, bactofilin family [Parapedobacter koreensis]|uniref:Protein CcmA, bactofilin family n=2 Tax=Parapedobacter koreensis TaxID=332977 RepID=A0A1H7NU86_9SPHI|nr:protein CcmA, bactofilin family [Parapedobacter koreensis]